MRKKRRYTHKPKQTFGLTFTNTVEERRYLQYQVIPHLVRLLIDAKRHLRRLRGGG